MNVWLIVQRTTGFSCIVKHSGGQIFLFLQKAVMLFDHSDVFIGQLSKYFIVYPIEAADRSAVINYRPVG